MTTEPKDELQATGATAVADAQSSGASDEAVVDDAVTGVGSGDQQAGADDKQASEPDTTQTAELEEGKDEAGAGAPAAAEPEPAGQPAGAKPSRRAPGAERRIAELAQERNRLREQLRAVLTQQIMGHEPAELKPEDTSAYWAERYRLAPDDATRELAAQRYQAALRNEMKREILAEIRREQAAAEQARIYSEQLAKLHERVRIFKDDGTIDPAAPAVQLAAQKAAQMGVPLADGQNRVNWQAFVYFLTDAALDLQGQGARQTAAALETQKLQTKKVIAKQGLESPTAGTSTKSTGTNRVDQLKKQLADLEKKRVAGPYNSALNREILRLREELRLAMSGG